MTSDATKTGDVIAVEVVYALPDTQSLLRIEVPSGTTVAQAIRHSGLADVYPEIDPDTASVGIFGQHVALDQPLKPGDRVEIYRPLIADPKTARRKRAQQKSGGG